MESDVVDQAQGHSSRHQNAEPNPNLTRNVLPKLLPKLMEVFTDPSVINEITQYEINSRLLEPKQNGLQSCFDRNGQRFQYSKLRPSQEIENIILQEGSLLEPPNSETEVIDGTEDYKSCSSSRTSRKSVRLDSKAKLLNYLKIHKIIAMISIIVVVFLLLISALSFMTIKIMSFESNTCTNLLNVSVRSIDEYNTATDAEGNKILSLDIHLERPNDWPTGVKIHSSKIIKDIRINGPFHTKKLIGLLSTIDSLEMLHLNNKENYMCIESIPPIRTFDEKKNVNITVKKIILENFNSLCKKALGIIHESMDFHGLETLSYVSGSINSENVRIFENLMEKYKRTLKRLEIIDSSIEEELFFGRKYLEFNTVNEILLEKREDDKNSFGKPVFNICTIFPNVERISFGSAIEQWNDVKDIYSCKHLRSLQVKIWVPPINYNFSLSFLAEQFPNLESAEITILFGTFLNTDVICTDKVKSIEGRKQLPKLLLANLRITSNCRLKF